jgi:hypothetical protein
MTAEIAVAEVVAERVLAEPALVPPSQRWKIFLFGGILLLLINFSGPAGGLVDIPASFFLKNKLHLAANQLAVFKLWTGAPLFLGFAFGFLRDRWSPFGLGDRGHLMIFGLVTGLVYGSITLFNPTYAVMLAGLFTATVAFQVVGSAAAGLNASIGQQQAVAGQMSALVGVAHAIPSLASFAIGGVLSQFLEGRGAVSAAHILFFIAAGLMAMIALFGAIGPRALFDAGKRGPVTHSFGRDIVRLLKHWPVWPVVMIQFLWQFAPASGIVLQYHMANTLHGTDAQWGLWNALFLGSFLPVYILYGFVCQKLRLSRLLWFGFTLAVIQMAPLLWVRTPDGALVAAVFMGLIGGIGQASLVDLAIRSAPPGLQGTMMMLFSALYYFSTRFGDLFGTWIYDRHGGFTTAVWATIIVYALILPVLLLAPRRLIDTKDGQALALEG